MATGSDNVFIGTAAEGHATTGDQIVAIGSAAGSYNGQGQNVFIGYRAGYNSNSIGITMVGAFAGTSNTTGGYNTFLGYFQEKAIQQELIMYLWVHILGFIT